LRFLRCRLVAAGRLPGVVMDYTDSEARAARIGGLDPKYVAVSIDGMRMAGAARAIVDADTRQFDFQQASLYSIESIEVNKTLTAKMDADAPAGTRKIKGADIEYSQQLVFLPEFWRGFSVFGSLSRTIPDPTVVRLVTKSANSDVRFRNHRFNVQLRATWNAAKLLSTSATQDQWQSERTMFDLSSGFRLSPVYEVTLSGRNIFNSPQHGYADTPRFMRQNYYFGQAWTLGLRGRF
jgi:hypothetical protein